ncbi:uncharacterized protein LOC106720025 [Papilio machaon]|uniref:uncharacterized protein LOC106720025 n=1 Tax=Papilio machaon TaxID=76193 RepID=UPI001E6634BA|nr:uncharacterized protein LOC106720025 [Papilio machaon]
MVTLQRNIMAVILVTIFAFLVSETLAGYVYQKPTIPFNLPINTQNNHDSTEEFLSQSHEKAVSYSIPIEEYNYVKQHKEKQQASIHNGDHSYNLEESKDHNLRNKENLLLLEKIIKHYDTGFTNLEETGIEHVENLNGNAIAEEVLQQTGSPNIVSINEAPIVNEIPNTNDNPVLIQNVIPQTENYVQHDVVQNIVEPVIHKHIYFHVPPPDIEEPVLQRLPEPTKKIYKIIFIKVPTQESSNNARIQQAINNQVNQNSAVSEKTLIYVLVKKPEPVQILPPPPPTPSQHEVLFVNYRGKQNSAPLPIASDLFQGSSVLSQTENLRLGLVNGQL